MTNRMDYIHRKSRGRVPMTAPIKDEYGFDSVKESKNNNIRMNRYRKNWCGKNTLLESVGEDELIDFATNKFFNNWLDCEVSIDDLCDAMLDGFYGKDFAEWEKIYGYGKDYEYLECAYDIGMHAMNSQDITALRSIYESKKGHIGKRNTLLEAKALTPEEKMDRWYNGTRKENIKACNIDKLKEYRKICRAKGYTEQVKIINAELKRRKDEGINESAIHRNEGIDYIRRQAMYARSTVRHLFDDISEDGEFNFSIGRDFTEQEAMTGTRYSLTERQTIAAAALRGMVEGGISPVFIKRWADNQYNRQLGESMASRRILEGKSDGGLRNDVLYSFLTKRATPIIVSALAAKGIKAEPHKFTERETIHRALIDIKSKGGINGMTQFALNYYDGGDIIAISTDKFMNGVKASKGFMFVSPTDNCIYGIPSKVMQNSWRGIMIDRRDPRIANSNAQIVIDASGMRNQISLCDPDLVRQLAVENGFVITMGQSDADKFKKELDEYKALE